MNNISVIIKSYFLVLFCTVSGRLLGILRELTIAYKFGTSSELDAYIIAMSIPAFFEDVLLMAIPATLVPIYVGYISSNKQADGLDIINNVSNILLCSIMAILVLTFIGAPVFFKLLAPGFAPQILNKTVIYYRALAVIIFFFLFSAVSTSILYSHKHFLTPSVKPIVVNICIIFFALILTKRIGIWSLILGTLVAGFFQCILLLPPLIKKRVKYKPILDLHNPSFIKIKKNMETVLLLFSIGYLSPIIARMFASTLDAGSVSALHYEIRLSTIFTGILAVPISTVLFPIFSELAQNHNMQKLGESAHNLISNFLLFITPLTVFFLVYREHIVRLLLERGLFSHRDTEIVGTLLLCHGIWFFCFPLVLFLRRVLLALQDTMPLLLANISIVVINVLLLVAFFSHFGLKTIPLVSSIISLLHLILLIIIVKRKSVIIRWPYILVSFAKVLSLSLAAFISSFFIRSYFLNFFNGGINLLIFSFIMFITIFLSLLYITNKEGFFMYRKVAKSIYNNIGTKSIN